MIVQVLNILRFFTWIDKKTVDRHFTENIAAWKRYYVTLDKYITNQPDLTILSYGKFSWLWDRLIRKTGTALTADFNTCEVIAVMNALISLGVEKNAYMFPNLLKHFEKKHGLILRGYFGTAPAALWKYLKKRQLNLKFIRPVELVENTSQIKEGNARTNSNNQLKHNIQVEKTYIVIFQNNRKDLSQGIHTMCMQVDTNGSRLLNDYAGNRYYASEIDALKAYNKGAAKLLQMVELSK